MFYPEDGYGDVLLEGPLTEAVSLFGDGLVRPEFDTESMEVLQRDLREAVELYDGTPISISWIARRTAAKWRYQDAVVVLTDGLEEFSDNLPLLRYRGQYLFIIREFEIAGQDLEKAAGLARVVPNTIETDKIDGTVIEPSTSLHYSIWFYSGLVHYVKSEYSQAVESFDRALELAQNNDTRITATDWLVLSLFKDRQDERAREILATTNLEVSVTDAAPYLERLRLLKDSSYNPNLTTVDIFDEITITYGLAFRAKLAGDHSTYRNLLNRILDTNIWAALSYIAAESDLKKLEDSSI